MIQNNVGKKIKLLRTLLGLTQPEFGEKIGVSVVSVWSWENGKTKPRDIFIKRIEDTFAVRLDDITSPIQGA